MAEKWELAFEDHKSGMKYKDIAAKYGVSVDTVKNWKRRKWGKVSGVSDAITKPAKGVKTTPKRASKYRYGSQSSVLS